MVLEERMVHQSSSLAIRGRVMAYRWFLKGHSVFSSGEICVFNPSTIKLVPNTYRGHGFGFVWFVYYYHCPNSR